jgi:hypothetical protein
VPETLSSLKEKTEEFIEETQLVWDKKYPLIAYIETPVMSLGM